MSERLKLKLLPRPVLKGKVVMNFMTIQQSEQVHPDPSRLRSIARYISTHGKLTDSGVFIDDIDNVTGAKRITMSDSAPLFNLGGLADVGAFGAHIFHNSSVTVGGGTNDTNSQKFYYHRIS